MSNINKSLGSIAFGKRTSLTHASLHIRGRDALPCTVQRMDEAGAEIMLRQPIVLPKTVRLHWEQFAGGAECDVVGTQGPVVRVAFTSDEGGQILRRFQSDRASQRRRAGI